MKTVIVKCIECGHIKEVKAGEVGVGEMPSCPKCYNLMIIYKSKVI